MKRPIRGLTDNRILTQNQKSFLKDFATSDLCPLFRLSGGTALSAFYLEHRKSEDIDLFSSEKIPFYAVESFLKTLPFVERIEYTKVFDRNIFRLGLKENAFLKIEFTHYPLKNIEESLVIDRLPVDSFLDIVVNKLCAIADRMDGKDYVDVYFALKATDLSIEALISLAEKKCEIEGIRHILKNRLLQIPDGVENLFLNISLKKREMETFFNKAVKGLIKKEIRRNG